MLNSAEHEITIAHKQMMKFLALSLSDVVFIMLAGPLADSHEIKGFL